MDTLITIYGENGEPMSVETTAAFESLSQHEKAEALRTMAHYLRDLALIEAVVIIVQRLHILAVAHTYRADRRYAAGNQVGLSVR